jgi:D-serine deaminase-like pyridoxal phosphate-dependent protein
VHDSGNSGWKTIVQQPALPAPKNLEEIRAVKLSAEHATIKLAAWTAVPTVGDRVEFVAGYSDATVFLHDYVYATPQGKVETIWPILGRGMTQ